ncbi:MAG: glycosyltransferase family 4 protein, partial [Actinomycetota bacterium]
WDLRADAAAFLELYRLLRRERFHVVHTHNPKPGVMGRIAARMAGVPCIVNTVHGLYATPEDRLSRRLPVLAVEAAAARLSDLELYQSEEDLVWARSRGVVSPSKSVLLGNGCDLQRLDPGAVGPDEVLALRRELGIPEGSIVVGMLGRLVREKGYLELFRAAREVRASHPQVRFLAVGGADPAKADAVSEQEVSRAKEDVIFAGWREDVPELLALMDVFVLPSWREGVPRAAIEAAAMGRPLVLSDIPGCRQVAREGVEGFLVPPRNAARLEEAIWALVDDPGRRRRMGSAARVRAVACLDEERVVASLLERYCILLRRKGMHP